MLEGNYLTNIKNMIHNSYNKPSQIISNIFQENGPRQRIGRPSFKR